MKGIPSVAAIAMLLFMTLAREVPPNVRAFYNRVKEGGSNDEIVLQSGFYSQDDGEKSFAYFQDNSTKAIYIHAITGSSLTNMDIDCDGDQSEPGDGRCDSSEDTQSETAFKEIVQAYSKGTVSDLNANFIPYVVFGNTGTAPGYVNFDPAQWGVRPLSVMAVVCGDRLVYGVWGDVNGDDGLPLVGEASLALATECYGTGMSGNNGHDENDVLYIGFPNIVNETVVKNATWGAKSFAQFEESIAATGNRLISSLF